jgi:cation:H+ antiporter
MTAIGLFALGLLLLVLGADSLLRGVAGFARAGGLRPTTIGVLLLGPVAAAPQLMVNGYALWSRADALAFGNAIGGSLASLCLALGIAALVAPLQPRMRLLRTQSLAVLAGAVVLLLLGLDGAIARWEGVVLLLAFAAALFKPLREAGGESDAVQAELSDFAETSTGPTQNLIRLGLGAALLFAGSRWLVQGAPAVGQWLGLGAFASGLTLLAVGSVLPAIVLAVLAAVREQGSVAVGQAFGACLCNILLSVGALALARPLLVPRAAVFIALPAIAVLALLLHLLLRQGARVGRREGALLVCAFVAWLAVVVGGTSS